MTEVSFYHLSVLPLEKALPKLLEKVLSLKKNTLVRAYSSKKINELNDLLWSFSTKIFIPHGSKEDGFKERQPIYLTDLEENPNNAEVLVALEGYTPHEPKNFIRILDLFDGNDEEETAKARDRWKFYKNNGFNITYWKQDAKGVWEQS